jgi:hypothetical protein
MLSGVTQPRWWHDEVFETIFTDNGAKTGKCDCCDHVGPLVECDSRRMDSDNTLNLCTYCAIRHHEYWDEMWDEYNRGRL